MKFSKVVARALLILVVAACGGSRSHAAAVNRPFGAEPADCVGRSWWVVDAPGLADVMRSCDVDSLDARLEDGGSACVVERTVVCRSEPGEQRFRQRIDELCAAAGYGAVQSHTFKIETMRWCSGEGAGIRTRWPFDQITFVRTVGQPCQEVLPWGRDMERIQGWFAGARGGPRTAPAVMHWVKEKDSDLRELAWPAGVVDHRALTELLAGRHYDVSHALAQEERWSTGDRRDYAFGWWSLYDTRWSTTQAHDRLVVSWRTLPSDETIATCSAPGATGAQAPTEVRFEAVVRLPPIEPKKGSKLFKGVLLERSDGSVWVASYSRDELWATFAEHHVEVTGTRYQPTDEALVLPHVSLTSLRIVEAERSAVPFVSMSGEVTLTGHFERWTWPPGTKLAGETLRRFVSDDDRAMPTASPDRGEPRDVRVTVRGRVVEPSLYEGGVSVAGVGGPQLWIDGE